MNAEATLLSYKDNKSIILDIDNRIEHPALLSAVLFVDWDFIVGTCHQGTLLKIFQHTVPRSFDLGIKALDSTSQKNIPWLTAGVVLLTVIQSPGLSPEWWWELRVTAMPPLAHRTPPPVSASNGQTNTYTGGAATSDTLLVHSSAEWSTSQPPRSLTSYRRQECKRQRNIFSLFFQHFYSTKFLY